MSTNFILVGGDFDNKGGKESGYINKFKEEFLKIKNLRHGFVCYNGGHIRTINEILNSLSMFDFEEDQIVLMWFPNISNSEGKVDIKARYPKLYLVSSKRNNNEYSIQELIQRGLKSKSNLFLTFSKIDNKTIVGRIYDPLGNLYEEGSNISQIVKKLYSRILDIVSYNRKSLNKIIKNPNEITIQNLFEFEKIVQDFGNRFHELIYGKAKIDRFLGNASCRCSFGFASVNLQNKTILCSPRNVDKKKLKIKDFVYVSGDDYYGDIKPSIDAPIHVKLYDFFNDLNYIIHSHVYIKDAPFTKERIPCGCLEEWEEIKMVCRYEGMNSIRTRKINLLGHGSIILAKTLEDFKNIEFEARPMPEKVWR